MLLPVSNLDDTLERYKKWVKPLVSNKEYNNTLEIVENFSKSVGKKLQFLLEEERNIYSNTSWLSSCWINSYLDTRITPIIATNFTSEIKLEKEYINQHSNDNILFDFISSLSEVIRRYKIGSFEKVYDSRNNEICSSQFQILNGSSRIPFKDRDIYHISNSNSDYITIFYKNNLFKVPVINSNNELINIKCSILNILNNTEYQEYSLSTICFADSNTAYELRSRYFDSNPFFNVLENSLFNISIFDENFNTKEEEYLFNMYMKAENSWVYKPLNFIYNLKNKDIYINCEHTYQDGGTILEIIKRTKKCMQIKDFNFSKDKDNIIRIKEYFDDYYKNEADLIKKDYSNRIKQFNIRNIFLDLDESYFNDNLKGFSKDAIMQFLLQYAQYKTFGIVRGIYEAVDMRDYQYGRTECVRSVSDESLEFVKSLDINDCDVYNKLSIAELEHKNRIKSCKAGNGVNRHLYGLYLMSAKLSDKDDIKDSNNFFNDISYLKISENFLSTTSLGYNDYLGDMFFTPVENNGFGINYYYTPNGIRFIVSYYISQEYYAQKLFNALKCGCDKIKNIKITAK